METTTKGNKLQDGMGGPFTLYLRRGPYLYFKTASRTLKIPHHGHPTLIKLKYGERVTVQMTY
jgi:hypothetical protein